MLKKDINDIIEGKYMNKSLQKIEKLVKRQCEDEVTGHDFFHALRVRKMAKFIAKQENAKVDMFVLETASLLHDVADWKFNETAEKGLKKVKIILQKQGVADTAIAKILLAIKDVSFKGAEVTAISSSFEGKIVQDADRLDAMGAIGIARTFAYGATKGSPIYDPKIKPKLHKTFEEYKKSRGTTINHFYEKLLLLKDRMNTKTARKIAEKRHRFMEEFLKRFYEEWGKQVSFSDKIAIHNFALNL